MEPSKNPIWNLTVEGDLVDLEDGHVVGQVPGVPSGVDKGGPGCGL